MYTPAGFYVVIIICIIALVIVICCLSVRVFQWQIGRTSSGTNQALEERQPLGAILSEQADNETLEECRRVSSWQNKHPPNTGDRWPSDPLLIAERGVAAWTFMENEYTGDEEEDSNVAVIDRTTLMFATGKGCALTNLPIPVAQECVYWEVKVLEMQDEVRLAIGLATKPYPTWRLPGWHRHSVAYHSHNGAVYVSDPFVGSAYGPPFKQGDVVGDFGRASAGFRFPMYPAVGATGPCQLYVNFGQQANTRHGAFGPKTGTLAPPPAYDGHEQDTPLFELTTTTRSESETPSLPPAYA
ncbi:Rsp5p-dependent ubiquitination, sorting of cargo proteins at the multivesicular body [Apophysomyces ossiformis]|uniref:Rsp5p-dependent ubiquitination, sorting of cargo proteins at the multivesicular body n=1 Tax=Apophysomyces ossiformis TaxID=679940 RepID=A0A8H7BXN8_9FUNG|nr:Rsp5p-dependent ubiquitination, sorting of cargo proteins at the multivesicular body [Apophysomyces ossiformis]